MNGSTANDDLYTLVCQTDQANELDIRLKTLPDVDDILIALHRHKDECVTLLILAVLYGKDDMVRIILAHSTDVNKLVDIPGSVCRQNGTLVRNATALWCACDRGYYTIARILIDIGGAKVDHGPRYSLLIDAIIVGRLDTVRFLIENNYVVVNDTECNGNYKLNSLIMAVIYGHTHIVAYLLEKRSNVDYSTPGDGKTPLEYAAIKGHLDIVRLLCQTGACSSRKNRNGQTPLMLAARHGHMHVVDYLLDQSNDYETSIQQLELAACSLVTQLANNIVRFHKMSNLLEKIFQIRTIKNLPKTVALPIAAYSHHQECQTMEEFSRIQHDNGRLYLEALIIRERILVPDKDETLFKPLLVFGDQLVGKGRFEHCLHLWEHTFYLYQNMNRETGLHRFVWLFCKMLSAHVHISPEHFVRICYLTCEPSQQKPQDDYIKNALCFLAIAVKVLAQPTLTHAERQLIYQWIKDLGRQKRLTGNGQTLLHLCVDAQTYHDINYRVNDIKSIVIFPDLAVIQLLLTHCSRWIDIDAVDSKHGNTALHITCRNDTYNSLAIVQLLLDFGAHVDCVNKHHQTPLDIARVDEIRHFLKTQYIPPRLKCLCARVITNQQFPYELIWPKETELNTFLFLHDSSVKQNKD